MFIQHCPYEISQTFSLDVFIYYYFKTFYTKKNKMNIYIFV